MASKNAQRDAKRHMSTPIGAIVIIIAATVALLKWVFGL